MNVAKKGQRTKGNVKPSSSSKAAELLAASGFGVPSTAGFLGFGNFEEEFEELNHEFRISLRKLVKKEPTTKIKALKELIELIGKFDEKAVSIAFQCWPRFYGKVALDNDFKVREESHNVMDAFFRKLKRQIATQIKSVLPFWLLGQHDPYPSTANSAKSGFENAFPSAKRSQALNFCKESIVSECADILYSERAYKIETSTSAGSDSDNSTTELRLVRLLTSALDTLTSLFRELSSEDCATLATILNDRFLSQPKFWNVAKNKTSNVKSAWFNFLSELICKFPNEAKSVMNHISPAVVNHLDRQTVDVCRSSWDCLLHCLNTFPQEFWQNVNFQKAFFPKVSSVLRKGGDGLARITCPCLLPLFSKFQTAGLEDLNQYYMKLMACFEQGVRICIVSKFDSAERSCFIEAYCDCLKYTVLQLCTENELLKSLLLDQCVAIVNLCVSSEITNLSIYSDLVDLIYFVLNIRKKRPEFDEEIRAKFALSISSFCRNSVKENSNYQSSIGRFLIIMSQRAIDTCTVEFLSEICTNFWSIFVDENSLNCLHALSDVLKNLKPNSVEIFMQHFRMDDREENVEIRTVEICCNKILDFIMSKDSQLDRIEDTEESTMLMSCLFALCKFLPTQESRVDLLNKVIQLHSVTMRYALLTQLVDVLSEIPNDFLQSAEFRHAFVTCFAVMMSEKIGQTISSSGNPYDWQIFVRILCFKRNEEIVFPALVDAILDDLLRLIRRKVEQNTLFKCIELVAQIAFTMFSSSQDIAISDMAKELNLWIFDLYCSSSLPAELTDLLQKAWNAGLKHNVNANGGLLDDNCLIIKIAQRLISKISTKNLTSPELIRLVSVAHSLLILYNKWISAQRDCETDNRLNECTFVFLTYLLPSSEIWSSVISDLTKDNFTYKFNAQFENILPICNVISDEKLHWVNSPSCFERLINMCTYCLRLRRIVVESETYSDSDSNFVEIFSNSFCSALCLIVYLRNVQQFAVVTNSVDLLVQTNRFVHLSEYIFEEFSTNLKTILSSNPNTIVRTCFEFAQRNGGLWILVLYYLKSEHVQFDENFSPPIEPTNENYEEIRILIDNKTILNSDMKNRLLGRQEIDLKFYTHFLWSSSYWSFDEEKLFFLSHIIANQENFDKYFLFNSDISSSSVDVVQFNIALIRFLQSLVENLHKLNGEQQDFVFCSLLAWTQSCEETTVVSVSSITFGFVVAQLFNKISEFVSKFVKTVDINSNFVDDWEGFFSNGCLAVLVSYFLQLNNDSKLHDLVHYQMCEMASSFRFLNGDRLLDYQIPLILAPDLDALNYPAKVQSLLLNFCPLLSCEKNRFAQLAAFNVLNKIVERLYEYEMKSDSDKSAKEETQLKEIPSYLLTPLKLSLENLHELSTFSESARSSTDDSVENLSFVEKNEKLYSNVLPFFLTWKLLLKYFSTVRPVDRPVYSEYLRRSGMLAEFLSTIFSLVEDVEDFLTFRSESKTANQTELENYKKSFNFVSDFVNVLIEKDKTSSQTIGKQEYFTSMPLLNLKEKGNLNNLKRLACHVYFECLTLFPAAIRQWWSNSDKKMKSLMNKFTSKYISPILSLTELQNISSGQQNYDNMKLDVKSGTMDKEIVASYKIEDLNMELVVTLPDGYPLTPVSVKAIERVGVSVEVWRAWMFELNKHLTQQNGSILDGLLMWKRRIDKHLEGVEECMICMSSVHASKNTLPSVMCRQCKKKFHGECLRKWFDSSNNMICPLCRNEFH